MRNNTFDSLEKISREFSLSFFSDSLHGVIPVETMGNDPRFSDLPPGLNGLILFPRNPLRCISGQMRLKFDDQSRSEL
jgi:hypothetical protein